MEELARTVLLDPIRVRIGDANAATTDVEQRLMYVGNEMGKLLAMRQLIQVCTLLLTHHPTVRIFHPAWIRAT